jgi:hypothetical protein
VIFVVSDNGTARQSLDCPLDVQHAKGSIYQLGSRVPLIVWGPRAIAPAYQGTQRSELIHVVDLWTTIAEVAGVVNPAQHLLPGRTLDGKSFRHLLDPSVPNPPAPRESALVEMFQGFKPHWFLPAVRFQRAAVNPAGYRYVHQFWTTAPPIGNQPEEFLRLLSDPVEMNNLAIFTGFTDGQSPCYEGACGSPPPPCTPPGPCKPGYGIHRSLQGVVCGPDPECDLNILFDIFDHHYAPFYCVCSTSD